MARRTSAHRTAPARPRSTVRPIALLALSLGLVTACGGDDAEPGVGMGLDAEGQPPTEAVLRRERVAVHFSKEEFGEALDELAPLLEGDDPSPADLITKAQVALRLGDFDLATAATGLRPSRVAAHEHEAAGLSGTPATVQAPGCR